MLVTLQEVLEEAIKGNYAVGAFNSPTLESARAVVEAAEELNVPVILSHAEVHDEIIPMEVIGPILIDLAKKATVPVVVHLDHGSSLETVKKAIGLGFSSVMIDASHLEYDDNVKVVKEVVKYAHAQNVSVEAELGTITSSGLGGEESIGNDSHEIIEIYTNPEIAQDFVQQTGIDALAASFGTVHGIYMTEPNLDFKRLQQISDRIQLPVVMHGGSGLSEHEYRTAINAGVRKINYYSYAAKAGAQAILDKVNQESKSMVFFYHDFTVIAKNSMKRNVKGAMQLFMNK